MICWGIGIVRIDKFKSSCVKLDKYDGNFLWIDFKFYFDVCVELNEWIIVEKGMYLVVVLRGQVQGVFGNLLREDKCNYRYLCRVLEERFVFVNQIELYRVQL